MAEMIQTSVSDARFEDVSSDLIRLIQLERDSVQDENCVLKRVENSDGSYSISYG